MQENQEKGGNVTANSRKCYKYTQKHSYRPELAQVFFTLRSEKSPPHVFQL